MISKILLNLDVVYVATGIVLLVFAVLTFRDRSNPHRYGSGTFWLLLAVAFALGSVLPHRITGIMVLIMVALDGSARVSRGSSSEPAQHEQTARAGILKNKIFLPVICIPLVSFVFALAFRLAGFESASVNRAALTGLGIGGITAAILALRITGAGVLTLFNEGRRINDAIGSWSLLPQLLASLGIIFTAANVGDVIAGGIRYVVPESSLFLLVLANCAGMAAFTIAMGNSFAAFPVIATGVLAPLIIKPLGADPSMVAILTLTAGSSGTLMTPMAANFNIVPTALLNMNDQYGVIKFQLPFAFAIWSFHVLLMYILIRSMTGA